ncbi:hypothetical protein [Streptomyces hiroshimensis]|uniref:Big-1 domain-containing protein n=1 Tax=Streptomyces hiroshimensis TaxID=66424 RepID=A0ABQ2Z2Z8_9ACTN|nr:hypothetical protein [Streptomyces hiroshimensis]GGY02745.1 hypothetical protein GCM10010324_57160 [Streptomyces hiroshimensis]
MPADVTPVTPVTPTSTSDSDKFPLQGAAVDLTWNVEDNRLWFVTAEGGMGYLDPRGHSNTLFPPAFGLAGRADSLLSWPGHGVWSYVAREGESAFVRCDQDGNYQVRSVSGSSRCRALALAEDEHGGSVLVAPLADRNVLVFLEPGGGVETSQVYFAGLYGIAVAEQDPTQVWLSSPESKAVFAYDMVTGRFGEPISVGAEAQDLAISAAGDVLWVATPGNRLYRYAVKDHRFTQIDIPSPAHRLLVSGDGTLWFASVEGDTIGYVLPGEGTASVISTGSRSRPSGLALAGDGQLWVALSGENALQRVSRHRLAVQSGDHQTAEVGQRFPEPLVVKATLLDGTPVAKQRIEFSVEAGSAVFENGKSTEIRYTGSEADQIGVATSSLLKALKEGPCVVTARWTEADAVTSFSRLVVTPERGVADHVRYVSGAGQTVPAGKSFDEPMKVVVEDKNGNPVEGAEVTFKIRGENVASFPGGKDTVKVKSGPDGSVESPVLTAGDKPGVFSVRVWVVKTAVSLLLDQTIE